MIYHRHIQLGVISLTQEVPGSQPGYIYLELEKRGL